MRKTIFSIIFLFSAVCLAFPQETQSQNKDSLDTSEEIKVEFEPIVVTATRSERPILRVPYTINVIGQKDIQRAEIGLSLDEAMRALPGIVVNNRYDISYGDRISIRGVGTRAAFGVRGIKLMLDGIPLTVPDGTSILENFDLGSVGKIEVLRGPSSSLYGNAAGGLINAKTLFSSQETFTVQPRFTIGSDGLQKWQGKVTGNMGRHNYFVNVNKLKLDGYRDRSSASYTSVNAVGKHEISNSVQLTSVFNYFDAPYLLSPSSLSKTDAEVSPTMVRWYVKQQGSGKQARQGQGGITLKYGNGGAHYFETTVYALSRSVLGAFPGTIFDLDRTSGGIRTVFNKHFQLGHSQVRWTVGMDVETQKNTQVEYENGGLPGDQVETASESSIFDLLQYGKRTLNQDEKVFNLGPFSELEFSLNTKWILTLGQRYDRYRFKVDDHFMDDGANNSGSRTMDKFSPMAGIIYLPNNFMKLFGNFSTAFQTPTTSELRNRPTGEGGFNPDLDPERMHSFELGVKGMVPEKGFSYDASFYILTIEDMLISYQLPDPEREHEFFFRNAGKSQNKGVELKMDWSPVKGLRTSMAYTFMDYVFKDFEVETSIDDTTTQLTQLEGNEVPGVPFQQLYAGVSYEHSVGVYAEIDLRWVDEYFANDFNGPPPGSVTPVSDFVNDGYVVVDVRSGYQHTFNTVGVECFVGINNLFDKRYNGAVVPNAFGDNYFQPAPGLNWYSGINVTFPNVR